MVLAFPAVAQLGADGYYRVQNYISNRYIYITDNKGSVDAATTSVDALAIQLWKGDEKAASDPATVLYFKKNSGSDYDIQAQSTGIHQIVGQYITIYKNSDGTYFAYGRNSGMTKYLGDANAADGDEGAISTEAKGDRRKWYIKPITATGDSYFGVKPTLSVGGKHYAPFFASFPFSAYSTGVKVYAITEYGYGMAVVEQQTGTVAGATACYIECPDTEPTNNRLNIGGTGTAVNGNQLAGVYFENYMTTHKNLTPYDKNTMRVLGTLADGTLGFITANITYLPANQSYLKVPVGSPASVKIVTRAEYDEAVKSLPQSVSLDQKTATIYKGKTLQLTATVAPENASIKTTLWFSSVPEVATVSADGLVTAVAPGTSIITVKTVNGMWATCVVTVAPTYPEAVSLSATTLKMYADDTTKLTATLTPEVVEHPELTWSSSDNTVATVAADGTVKALKAGTATISVKTANGLTASCALTVHPHYPTSITLSPAALYLHEGEEGELKATISPADVKDKTITWSTSDAAVAAVDVNGKVFGLKQGSATITVKSPGGVSATCEVTVARQLPTDIELNLTKLVIEVGDKRTVRATVHPEKAYSSVTWSTSDASIATVSSIGEIVGVGVGYAEISATTDNGLTAVCTVDVLEPGIPAESVTITPSSLSLSVGEYGQLTATVSPEDVSNKFITWTSNNEKVAKVDSEGVVTAISEGTSIIYARCGSKSANISVKVVGNIPVSSIILDKTSVEAVEGEQFTLVASVLPENATDKSLAWYSSNNTVAIVDRGVVHVLVEGSAVITAEALDGSGVSASCTVLGKSGIDDVLAPGETVTVYSIDGVLLHRAANAETLRNLAPGFYIFGKRKVFIR